MSCLEKKALQHLENARKELETSRLILKELYFHEGRMSKESVYEIRRKSWDLNAEYAGWEVIFGELEKHSAIEKIKIQTKVA